MTLQHDIATMRTRMAKAEADRGAWRTAGGPPTGLRSLSCNAS
jgi:hypothetical protein